MRSSPAARSGSNPGVTALHVQARRRPSLDERRSGCTWTLGWRPAGTGRHSRLARPPADWHQHCGPGVDSTRGVVSAAVIGLPPVSSRRQPRIGQARSSRCGFERGSPSVANGGARPNGWSHGASWMPCWSATEHCARASSDGIGRHFAGSARVGPRGRPAIIPCSASAISLAVEDAAGRVLPRGIRTVGDSALRAFGASHRVAVAAPERAICRCVARRPCCSPDRDQEG